MAFIGANVPVDHDGRRMRRKKRISDPTSSSRSKNLIRRKKKTRSSSTLSYVHLCLALGWIFFALNLLGMYLFLYRWSKEPAPVKPRSLSLWLKFLRLSSSVSNDASPRNDEREVVGPPTSAPTIQMATAERRPGFMVLGMHRSGTSLLTGILVQGFGYNTGGPLIGGKPDNPKGFFERIDVVLANDEFFRDQSMHWAGGLVNFDAQRALERFQKITHTTVGRHVDTALAFLRDDPSQVPWVQKDPRMCVALPVWLDLLSSSSSSSSWSRRGGVRGGDPNTGKTRSPPATVFTYRHPIEVARSLQKREEGFTLAHGFRLWIVYNQAAVQNSADTCRVVTSNEAVLLDPETEVRRISHELTERCGVAAPPYRPFRLDVVRNFIDPNLQTHANNNNKDTEERTLLAVYKNPHDGVVEEDCRVYDYDRGEGKRPDKVEMDLYLKAMKIYCDLKSGIAYEKDYIWPKLG